MRTYPQYRLTAIVVNDLVVISTCAGRGSASISRAAALAALKKEPNTCIDMVTAHTIRHVTVGLVLALMSLKSHLSGVCARRECGVCEVAHLQGSHAGDL